MPFNLLHAIIAHLSKIVGKYALYEEIGTTHTGYTILIDAHTEIGILEIFELGNGVVKGALFTEYGFGRTALRFCVDQTPTPTTNLKMTAVKKGYKHIERPQA